jgi:glycosyltransferase involved in cell wall biosynthesis
VQARLTARRRAATDAGAAEIAYIVRSYPRLSQTFVVNEVLALERLGLRIRIFALARPGERTVQEAAAEVRAPTEYLDRPGGGRRAAVSDHLHVAARAPRRYVAALAYVLRRHDLDSGYVASSRFACFARAVDLARRLASRDGTAATVRHVHAHFAHDPTLVALLVRRLTGMPFTFTAHARDLYHVPPRALAERVAAANAVVTCCDANVEYLRERAAGDGKLRLIHHGVDIRRFQPRDDGAARCGPPLVVSIGRLIEKKGFDDLIAACRRVKDAGLDFRCAIYGDGPLRNRLGRRITDLGLAREVTLAGERTQRQLASALRAADVFCLTPCVTADDRDGIPNVLLEAMASGLPVVSTAVAGVPEAVAHGHTGLLARPHDVEEIARHLGALLADERRRAELGARARAEVVRCFDADVSARRLAALFQRQLEVDSWPA